MLHIYQQDTLLNNMYILNHHILVGHGLDFYDHDGIRDTTSPIRFDAPQAEFPFSGSKSGITTLESRKYLSDHQGTTILTIQCKLFAIYQPPHDYTGVLKLRIFNIKYFNCRGDEIHNGDKCLPILKGHNAKINTI